MKKGDKVRIKSSSEIKKTLDRDDSCDGVIFTSLMHQYCDILCTINYICKDGTYMMEENSYSWVKDWLIPVEEITYLNDGSKEQRSLCLALVRQAMSGNTPSLNLLSKNLDAEFPTKKCGGFNYLYFSEDDWYDRIARNIPDWPCLKLKPEILEEAIKNCLKQYNLDFFKKVIKENIISWFTFSPTGKEEFWHDVHRQLSSAPNVDKTNLISKHTKNETELQRRKSTVIRGAVPEGNQQSSGKCKATTCSGYLSYQICSGR